MSKYLFVSIGLFLFNSAFSQNCPPRPVAALKLANNDICIGSPISVQNQSLTSGNDLYYIWNWGDGTKSDTLQSAASAVHVYEQTSNDTCSQPNGGYIYKVKLTAKNRADGCLSDSTTIDAHLYFSPIADFTAPREVFINNAEVTFINTTCPLNTPGTKIMWNFGDPASGKADTSSQINTKHVFSGIGTYTVNLIVTSFCNASIRTSKITVKNSPIIATQDLPVGLKVKTSPNPFNDYIHFKIEQDPNATKIHLDKIYVQDILGRILIKNQIINDSEINLNTSALSEGTYIVSVWDSERQFILGKFMKIK